MYKKPGKSYHTDIILSDERLDASLKPGIKISMFTFSNPI